MEKVIHRADTRGHFDHGWLKTYHTFSFADYYDSSRMHFGALRVLNDDTVDGGRGFGRHPHENMEIVSIPLEGTLEHGDSMGNHSKKLSYGEIQVMSAGTGIMHSEFNGSETETLKFLQIWVFPDKDNHTPRYEDIKFAPLKPDTLQLIVAPEGEGGTHTGWIHQQAWFYLGELSEGTTVNHSLHSSDSGVYIFVLEGEVEAADTTLKKRDGMGVTDIKSIDIKATQASRILLMEVPK